MDELQPNTTGPVGMGGPTNELGAPLPQVQPQQQAPPPDPQVMAQQAQAQHDSMFGRAAKTLMGMQTSYSVGPDGTLQSQQVPEKPGSFFRKLLGASLLGGAAGANGDPAQGFLGGLVRGGAASVQANQQQDNQQKQQAQTDFADQQKVQQQGRENTMMQAQIAQMHAEQVARQHSSDLADEASHQKHNAASAALVTTLTAAGGTPAMIPMNGKAASDFTANDLASAYIKDPSILKAPQGYLRTFVDTTDSSNLSYNGHQWVTSGGEPVNMTDNTNVKAIDTPIDSMGTKIPTTGKDINAAYGGKLVDPDKTYPMAPTDMVALNTKRMAESKAQASIDLERHKVAQGDAELGLKKQELGLKQRELSDKEKASGVDANGEPSSLARDIASGHVTVDRLGYLLAKNPDLVAGVMKVDPNFDSAKAAAYPKVYQDFTSTKNGSAGGTLVAAGTAFKHLQELRELNTLESRIPGTADYQRYQNKLDTVAPELAKVYNDSTIPGIAGYKKTLGALTNRDPAIVTQAQSMGDKVDALNQTWTNAAPSAKYEAPLPGMDAHANAARASLDPRYKKSSPDNGQTQQFSHVSASGKFGYNGTQWVPIPGK